MPGRIVAMGGGGFLVDWSQAFDQFVLNLSGQPRPRVCMLATASGDSDFGLVRFHNRFDGVAQASHLSLFNRPGHDLREFLLGQDVIYVGGGNTANLLAIWRLHGVDVILREAWAAGVVLCGWSAGSLCWFEAGVTDSFGPTLVGLKDGLGFVAGSNCPHYDSEPLRRPTYQRLVASGELPPGLAADDGAALVFAGADLVEVVSARPGARAYRVERGPVAAVETPLAPRLLD